MEKGKTSEARGRYKTISLKKEDYDKLDGIAQRYHTKKGWIIIALLKDYDAKKRKRCSGGSEWGKDFW